VAKASGSPREGEQAKRPRFWVGPLVAGACFALGYGLTQRLIVMQGALREPRREAFATQAFPGDRPRKRNWRGSGSSRRRWRRRNVWRQKNVGVLNRRRCSRRWRRIPYCPSLPGQSRSGRCRLRYCRSPSRHRHPWLPSPQQHRRLSLLLCWRSRLRSLPSRRRR
jgi:hypothetical protein